MTGEHAEGRKAMALPEECHSVPRETQAHLEAYVALLEKWNAKINLVGRSTVFDIWNRHVADSLQLIPFFPEKAVRIVDVGTGAGLPGLVLAAAGFTDCHLVEVDQKKAGFLRIAAGSCGMPATIHACRVQDVALDNVHTITARAYAALNDIFSSTEHLCGPETVYILPKGRSVEEELAGARANWDFSAEKFPSRSADSWILRIRRVRRKGRGA